MTSTMDFTEFAIFIAMGVTCFLLGRSTYTPERWVENKMGEIESKIFERMSGFFTERMAIMRDGMTEAMAKGVADQLKEKIGAEVFHIKGKNSEDTALEIMRMLKKRGIPEEEYRTALMKDFKLDETKFNELKAKI